MGLFLVYPNSKITWDKSISSQLPEVAYKDVMESDKGLAEWLNNIVSGHGNDWLLFLSVLVVAVLLCAVLTNNLPPFGHFALSTSLGSRMSVAYQLRPKQPRRWRTGSPSFARHTMVGERADDFLESDDAPP